MVCDLTFGGLVIFTFLTDNDPLVCVKESKLAEIS